MISRRSTEHIEQYCDIVRFRVEKNWFLITCRGVLLCRPAIQAKHISEYLATRQITPATSSPLFPEDLLVESESVTILGDEVYQLLVGSISRMPHLYLLLVGGYSHHGSWCGDGSDIDKQ